MYSLIYSSVYHITGSILTSWIVTSASMSALSTLGVVAVITVGVYITQCII